MRGLRRDRTGSAPHQRWDGWLILGGPRGAEDVELQSQNVTVQVINHSSDLGVRLSLPAPTQTPTPSLATGLSPGQTQPTGEPRLNSAHQ